MIVWAWSRNACRCVCQLQVCKLLQYGGHVVCPKGLNGGLEPVLLSVPQQPIRDMNTISRLVCKSLWLQVDLPLAMLSDKIPLIPDPHKAPTPPSSPCLEAECPSKMVNYTDMATELQELLSQSAGHLWPSLREQQPKETNISSLGCPIDHQSRRPA